MLGEKVLADVKGLGISAAACFDISEREFKFDARYRKLCEDNVCGSYGRNYMCPPAVGTLEDCMRDVLGYKHALVIETIYGLEDSFDYEGMMDGGKAHAENVNKVWDYIKANIDYKGLKVLGAGKCTACAKCGMLDNVPCRLPDRAVSSIEAHGIDVAHLTETHGLKYINGEDTVTYVGLFLLS